MKYLQPSIAEAFPPGQYIRDELAERGWSQRDLARVIGRPLQMVNEIINGRKQVTPETAIELAAAFGTSAELWMNLEVRYRLGKARRADPAITKRAARLMSRAS